jgi:hypothetical protein
MPRETYDITSKTIAVDSVAAARATALVSAVQDSYNAYELAKYGSNNPPDVDEDYVRMCAVRIGLNRLVGNAGPTAATFAEQDGDSVSGVSVEVENGDLARAQAFADLVSVDLVLVLSAALCTGLGAMSSDPASATLASQPAIGPFIAP